MTWKKNLMVAFAAVAMGLSFSGCATSLAVDVVRPAELDLNGAKSIAVLPFRPSPYHGQFRPYRGYKLSIMDYFFGFTGVSADEQHAISLLKSGIEKGLAGSPYLKLISSDAVESALRRGNDVPSDVYLTGEVVRFEVRDKKSEYRKKIEVDHDDDDDDGSATGKPAEKPNYVTVAEFKRHVDMEFFYQIVDSKTDEIISFGSECISRTSLNEKNPRDLPSPFKLIREDVESTARKILRKIQPYTITKYIELLSYSSKDAEMKYADDLASDGLVKESYEKFLGIYTNRRIYEAGYNAAMLLEAMGRLTEAQTLMGEVAAGADPKVSKKAVKALKDIENEIRQSIKLEKQNRKREGADFNQTI